MLPVTLPPGRAKLAISPSATGSAMFAPTMAMFFIACIAAIAAGVPPAATITLTLRATS